MSKQTKAELVSALKMHSLQKSPKNESTLLKTYILFVQRWKKQFPCFCASVLNCFLRDNTDLYFISGQLFTRCGLGANQNTKRKTLLHRIIPRTSKLKFFQKWWKLDNWTYAMSSSIEKNYHFLFLFLMLISMVKNLGKKKNFLWDLLSRLIVHLIYYCKIVSINLYVVWVPL